MGRSMLRPYFFERIGERAATLFRKNSSAYNQSRHAGHAAPPRTAGLHCPAAAGPGVLSCGDRVLQNDAAIFFEAAVGGRDGGGGRGEDRGIYFDGGKSTAGACDYAGRGGVAPKTGSGLGAAGREREESGAAQRANDFAGNGNRQ